MTEQAPKTPQFFLTSPAACPYVDGLEERKVFTYLSGPHANEMNTLLTLGGFRRSQKVAYRPACSGCNACVSVRIPVDTFLADRSMKRILKVNHDIIAKEIFPKTTSEQYGLFHSYLDARHAEGGMAGMTMADYKAMVEDTSVDTRLIEYRLRVVEDTDNHDTETVNRDELVGIALTDVVSDGYSMVYSFYNPQITKRSLGTFMILDHIRRTIEAGLPFVYLGYWVEGSRKMQYKMRFQPLEHLNEDGWTPLLKS